MNNQLPLMLGSSSPILWAFPISSPILSDFPVKRELFELNNNHSYELKQGKRDKNTF
jgi:hypothetical protein